MPERHTFVVVAAGAVFGVALAQAVAVGGAGFPLRASLAQTTDRPAGSTPRVRAQRETSGLTFVLQGVRDFVVPNCPGLKDVYRDRVERETF
jgi:hypothetical protein